MLKVKWEVMLKNIFRKCKNAILSWFWAGKLNIGYVQAIFFLNSQIFFEIFFILKIDIF